MWDAFAAGVAISIMHKSNNTNGENEFAEMEYMNITVVTSNKPYGVHDGSNPFFDGHYVPRFNLTMGGVHSGHVQTGLRDPFCIVKNGTGKCQVVAFVACFSLVTLNRLIDNLLVVTINWTHFLSVSPTKALAYFPPKFSIGRGIHTYIILELRLSCSFLHL